MKAPSTYLSVILLLSFLPPATAHPQGSGLILYGDVKVDESKAGGLKPISLDVILYTDSGTTVARQTVSSNGRYRFNGLTTGFYRLVVEIETREVARIRVDLTSPLIRDRQQDIDLEWKATGKIPTKATVLSVADRYERNSADQAMFEKASAAADKKQYDQAAELLGRIVSSDPKDFQAWTELANIHFLQKDFGTAENEYLHAIDSHPGFFPALFNLGRLEITLKKYDVAIEALTKAIKARPESPDANYFLGEAYLQIKKGSLAVGYLNEALRLDPLGMADVHLRLAALYHAAGLKDKAAAEYEQFLKKRPDYADRKKLEEYIAAHKKP